MKLFFCLLLLEHISYGNKDYSHVNGRGKKLAPLMFVGGSKEIRKIDFLFEFFMYNSFISLISSSSSFVGNESLKVANLQSCVYLSFSRLAGFSSFTLKGTKILFKTALSFFATIVKSLLLFVPPISHSGEKF